MSELCCCPPEAGNAVCDLPVQNFERLARAAPACPGCGKTAKPVQGQTVNALLSVSLREVRDAEYLFCRTQTCPVAYFPPESDQTFTVEQIREKVFQKEPGASEVWVCYCFRHAVGEVRTASLEARLGIMDDINTGTDSGQCACELRNPQGSRCLGNVRGLIKRLEKESVAVA